MEITLIKGRDIKPLDRILVFGNVCVVESVAPIPLGKRLMLTNGMPHRVRDEEELICYGKADSAEVLGIPRSEMICR